MAFGQNVIEIVIKARDKFSTAFNKANLSMQSFRKSALAMGAIGGAIAFGLKKAVDTAIKLETAMVGVRKTTGLSVDAIAGLRKEFIDLSKVMPLSVTELASIGEVAGQLGITGVENIKSFTEVAAKMSIATELSAEAAALAMAKISNAMGLPIKEAEKLGSAINQLSNTSAASSSEIISAMVRVSGSAKALGLSTEVVTGLTAALIASGEPAERAGTKLRSAFDQIVKNMDRVVKIMPDFRDAFKKDANKAILSLINNISKIEDPLERQTQSIDIFGTVGASAINKLSGNLPEMNRLIEESSAQFKKATSLTEEYNIASQSTENQIQLAKNAFAALQLEIADVLMPTLLPLIQAIRRIFDWFSNLPGPIKQAIVIFGVMTAAIFLMGAAIALLTLVSSPWLLILLGIAAAVTTIIVLFKNWEKISFKVKAVLYLLFGPIVLLIALIKNFKLIVLALKNTFISFGNIVLLVWNGIISTIEGSINYIVGKINWLIKVMNKIPGVKIPLIPEIDLGKFKAELMEFDFGVESLNNKNNGTTVNIENVVGLDPEEISKALSDELNSKVSL